MSEFKKNLTELATDLDKKEQLSQQISAMINRSEQEILDKLTKMRLGDYLNLISSVKSSNIEQVKRKLNLDNETQS